MPATIQGDDDLPAPPLDPAIPPSTRPVDPRIEAVELDLLLRGIHECYGYDFRDYARASIKRRVVQLMDEWKLPTISALQDDVLHDQTRFHHLLETLTIGVSEMFRDPPFFSALREHILPIIRTYPFLRAWHAGCATGEEVYSFAIMLEEEAMANRACLYATDINERALKQAQKGIYPADRIKIFTENYQRAGGKRSFSDYYTSRYGLGIMRATLRDHVVFSIHNLTVDRVFGEMNIIFCRNVLIYFNAELKTRVYELFRDSLCHGGFLCLGLKESIPTSLASDFQEVIPGLRIYRKTSR